MSNIRFLFFMKKTIKSKDDTNIEHENNTITKFNKLLISKNVIYEFILWSNTTEGHDSNS